MTIPTGTKFIGIAPDISLDQKRSALINSESAGYTAQEIVQAVGTCTILHVTNIDNSYYNINFIGKNITDFAIFNNGDEQISIGNVDIENGFDTETGTFTFNISLGNTYTIFIFNS